MRGVCLALVISSTAWADATVPLPPRAAPKPTGVIEGAFRTHCADLMESARTQIAALSPVFASSVIEEAPAPGSLDGRIERVELRLDESLVPGAKPFVLIAQVWSRRSLWGDDSATMHEWSPVAARAGLSIYRQTHRFEGQIAAQGVGPIISSLTVQRIIELYLKPAVDDCLRRFD